MYAVVSNHQHDKASCCAPAQARAWRSTVKSTTKHKAVCCTHIHGHHTCVHEQDPCLATAAAWRYNGHDGISQLVTCKSTRCLAPTTVRRLQHNFATPVHTGVKPTYKPPACNTGDHFVRP